MPPQLNLTEAECVAILKQASEALTFPKTEGSITAIVENLRASFDVTCVTIREIIPRPCSLRYTYEAIQDPAKPRLINETVTFDEDVWQGALARFSEGCYIYKADRDQTPPNFMWSAEIKPLSTIQIPMYYGSQFLGVLDLIDFEKIRDWTQCECTTLNICANMICQHLHRLNAALAKPHDEADTDPLTGLMNFRQFTETLDKRLAEILSSSPVVVIYTDIHHFKYINETYGYKKGDELLKLAAQTFVANAEGLSVLTSRVYADHFVTAGAIQEEQIPAFDEYVHEQNERLSKLLQTNCPDVRVRVITGICYIRDANITAATAIANANLARKIAKRENLRKPVVFADDMMEEIKYQEYLNNELPKAIANRYLKVYYQPKINCADDSLYGAEALVRWQKPDGSFIYPDQFIPIFEKNGNIMEVDFFVYREVFRYIRSRLNAGLPVFPISMNVSRVHFRSNRIIPYIEELLQEYKIPPELVEFELTENIYMKNFSKADEFVKTCRSRGIQVSMDDFGSGYSSLNLISTLNIDTLKIDKIFLKNDILSDNDKTVIGSMIAMAKQLGMKVICEGVETELQTLFLKNTLCDQIQGYYYARPMDEASFDQFVEKQFSRSTGS